MRGITSTSGFWRNNLSIERSGVWQHVRRLPRWARVGATLSAGIAGGAAFAAIGAPLAWMLGAMTTSTLLAIFGAPVAGSSKLRMVMASVLGVLLGSAFSPEILHKLPQWLGVLAILCVVLLLHGASALTYLYRKARFSWPNAFFAAAPGGLIEMVVQGDKAGGNTHTVALLHATRILFVVAVVPLWFRISGGVHIPALPARPHAPFTIEEALWLIGCAAVGLVIGIRFRLPAPHLVGPMVLSIAAHAAGLSHLAPPALLIAAAQVTIGTSIGTRFAGRSGRELRRTVGHGAVSACLMLIVAVVSASIAAPLLGLPRDALILAFTPGGLAEMSLIALSMNTDTALISAMHSFRILLVVILANSIYRLLSHWRRILAPGTARDTTNS